MQIQAGSVVLFNIAIVSGNAPLNVSAHSVSLVMLKPDGKTKLTNAMTYATDGKDGLVRYATTINDLDVPGIWRFQVKVGTTMNSEIDSFEVIANL